VGVVLLCYAGWRGYRASRSALRAQAQLRTEEKEELIKCVRQVTKLQYPACFVSSSGMRDMGRLRPHEELRNEGALHIVDTMEELQHLQSTKKLVFVSHQWLDEVRPDPNNVHYKGILQGIDFLLGTEGVHADDLLIWVDYVSIPQTNENIKQLSISSLPAYATGAHYFLVVAPPTRHSKTNLLCNLDTYQRRGWCRLEQWACMVAGNMDHVLIIDSLGSPPRLPVDREWDNWWARAIHVFDGDFSHPGDRVGLVGIVTGLWALAVHKMVVERANDQVFELVDRQRDTVFPREFFGDRIDRSLMRSDDYLQNAGKTARRQVSRDFRSNTTEMAAAEAQRLVARHEEEQAANAANSHPGERQVSRPRSITDALLRSNSQNLMVCAPTIAGANAAGELSSSRGGIRRKRMSSTTSSDSMKYGANATASHENSASFRQITVEHLHGKDRDPAGTACVTGAAPASQLAQGDTARRRTTSGSSLARSWFGSSGRATSFQAPARQATNRLRNTQSDAADRIRASQDSCSTNPPATPTKSLRRQVLTGGRKQSESVTSSSSLDVQGGEQPRPQRSRIVSFRESVMQRVRSRSGDSDLAKMEAGTMDPQHVRRDNGAAGSTTHDQVYPIHLDSNVGDDDRLGSSSTGDGQRSQSDGGGEDDSSQRGGDHE